MAVQVGRMLARRQTLFATTLRSRPPEGPGGKAEIVAAVESEEMAVALALRLSGQSQARIAKRLGISPAYLSAIKAGERIVPTWFVRPFGYATGCNLLRQYIDLQTALRIAEGHQRPRDVVAELARACADSWRSHAA